MDFISSAFSGLTSSGVASKSFVGPLTQAQSAGVLAGKTAASIGQGVSLGSRVTQQLSQQQTLRTNQRLAEIDQQTALQNVALSEAATERAVQESREDTLSRLSTIRSIQTKSGVVTSEGSPLLVQREQAKEGRIEENKIRQRGAVSTNAALTQSAVAGLRAQSFASRAGSQAQNLIPIVGTGLLTGTRTVLE